MKDNMTLCHLCQERRAIGTYSFDRGDKKICIEMCGDCLAAQGGNPQVTITVDKPPTLKEIGEIIAGDFTKAFQRQVDRSIRGWEKPDEGLPESTDRPLKYIEPEGIADDGDMTF